MVFAWLSIGSSKNLRRIELPFESIASHAFGAALILEGLLTYDTLRLTQEVQRT
jgi:hypothetical protein